MKEKLLDNLKDTLIKHDVNSAVVDIGRLALDLESEVNQVKASLRDAVLEAMRKTYDGYGGDSDRGSFDEFIKANKKAIDETT